MRARPIPKNYNFDEPGIPFEEYRRRYNAYEADKRAYREEVHVFAQKEGVNDLTKEKLKALLAGNLIQSTGGKAILRWRWLEYCAGRPVVRSRNYLKDSPPPSFTMVDATPRMGFLGLPLDVWEYHIFPHMHDLTLVQMMFLTRQLQARAHRSLTARAQARFGPGGTPLAIICSHFPVKYNCKPDPFHRRLSTREYTAEVCVKMCVLDYGCMEHVRMFRRYMDEQKALKKLDKAQQKSIAQDVVATINAVCPENLQVNVDGEFVNTNINRLYYGLRITCWSSIASYDKQCRMMMDEGETRAEKIVKRLKRFYPTDPFFGIAITWTLPEQVHEANFVQFMYKIYQKCGLGWLQKVCIIADEQYPPDVRRIYIILDETDVYLRHSYMAFLSAVQCDLDLLPMGMYAFDSDHYAFVRTYKKIKA